jgi:dTDP-4-dehydrorhamnose 3,5-epimerase
VLKIKTINGSSWLCTRFSVLSETASVPYKVDQLYHKESEKVYMMMLLNIDWRLSPEEVIVSEKDLILLSFDDID